MKKNRFIKIAAVVFTLCLITTCGISTTLAKYTTGGDVQDSARVAKWGVHLEMQNDTAFKNEYTTHDAGYSGSLSVKSIDDKNVVAPGTNGSSSFAITGQPEVAVRITIDLTIDGYVFLKAGEYSDPTTDLIADDKFTLTDEYNPVIFTLKQKAPVDVVLKTGTIQQIQEWLNQYNADSIADRSNEYPVNSVLDSQFELSWTWDFNGNHAADTLLGNLQAGETAGLTSGTGNDYNCVIQYSIEITVTQID